MPKIRDWQALFQDIVSAAYHRDKTCYHLSKRGRMREQVNISAAAVCEH